jgi:hypothetical protein
MTRPSKLEHWSLETILCQVLEFVGKARANWSTSFLGKLLVLPPNVRLDWKMIARYKCSSLFGLDVSDEGKSFITLTLGVNLINLFFFKEANKLECLSLASILSLA